MTLYTVESEAETKGMIRFHGWFTSSSEALKIASEICHEGATASVYRWQMEDDRNSVCSILNGKLTYTGRWLVFSVWNNGGQVSHKRIRQEGKPEGWIFSRSSDHSSSGLS